MARERYYLSRVVESRSLCGAVKHLEMVRDDEAPFSYVAGQFIMIHFLNPQGVEINRSYSMAGAPVEGDKRFALCVKKVDGGQGSTLIHDLQPGDTVKTSGPYGRFTLKKTLGDDLVLAATGTGVAPFRAMVPELEALLEAGRRVWLLFGVRYTRELLYHEEWQALAARHPGFCYRPVVSQPEAEAGWEGPVGYVSGLLPELDQLIEPASTTVYLCGVPAMIDDMSALWMERGLSRRSIKTEKYASPPPPGKKIKRPPEG